MVKKGYLLATNMADWCNSLSCFLTAATLDCFERSKATLLCFYAFLTQNPLRFFFRIYRSSLEPELWQHRRRMHLMQPAKDRGFLARGRSQVLPTLPRIGLITVFDAVLTARQSGQKLQCYGNPIANNFFQNWIFHNLWIATLKY